MKIFKKLLALVLSLMLVSALVPFGMLSVSAATSGTTGDCTWTLNGTELTISGNGEMADYYYDDIAPWSTTITKVTIGGGVTNIGDFAFFECAMLTSVTIGNSITSIGYNAFGGCIGLASIDIPNSVVSIGDSAFENCTGLKSVVIPDSVTSIGEGAFYFCNTLTSATLGKGITSLVFETFSYCTKLVNINIPDGVTIIGSRVFHNCIGLKNITIPDSVETIAAGAFENCTGLASISIPAGVTTIDEYAFSDCSGLESITVDKNNKTYYADGNCLIETAGKKLILGCKNSIIPSDGSVTSIGNYAFRSCSGLTSVTIPDSVTSIGYQAFYCCEKLTDITIPDSVISIDKDAFCGCSELTSATIGNGATSIGEWAFANCTRLTSIIIPNSITKIDEYAFWGCEELKNVYYYGTAEQKIKISIGEKNESLTDLTWIYLCKPAKATLKEYTSSSITVQTAGNMLFSIDGENWQSSGEFTGLTPATTYKIYSKQTDTVPDGYDEWGINSITVTTDNQPQVEPNVPQIVFESKKARKATEFTVTAEIKNNPGFSAASIKIIYDTSRLQLETALLSEAYSSGATISYDNLPKITFVKGGNVTTDGVFLTLTFKVLDTAEPGDSLISLEYDEGDISNYSEEDVNFAVVQGTVTVTTHTPGDITGDGNVNSADLTRLLRYLNDWNVEVNEAALDVTGDGKVNSADLTRLLRYLNDWPVEIH